MQDWLVWVVAALAAALAIVAVALGLALLRARTRTERSLADSRAETAALRDQLELLERRLAPGGGRPSVDAEFVITDLGRTPQQPARESAQEPVPAVGGALFADLVLRETVVKAASLAHGVRRALDPETRNRIRFEMRREVKRARKQRRADQRRARRDWEARRRAGLDEEGSAA